MWGIPTSIYSMRTFIRCAINCAYLRYVGHTHQYLRYAGHTQQYLRYVGTRYTVYPSLFTLCGAGAYHTHRYVRCVEHIHQYLSHVGHTHQ